MRNKLIRSLFLAATLLPCVLLNAAAPELSADDPLVYDAASGSLVARGRAVFTHDEFRLEADEIRYVQTSKVARASGNVRVTRPGLRLVAESLSYDSDKRSFSCGKFRAGYPPLVIEGDSASGDIDNMELTNVRAWMGEPGVAVPSLVAEKVNLLPGRRLLVVGAQPGLGSFRVLRIPQFSGSLDEAPELSTEGELGFRGKLGAYLRSRSLVPVTKGVSAGANLDIYSSRGVLVGPALQYDLSDEQGQLDGSVDFAWISDQGNTGYDYYARNISQNRWLFSARHRQDLKGGVRMTAYINLLSDLDMLRDFRPEAFDGNQYPDSFIEWTMPISEDIVASSLVRFSAFGNDYPVQNRLPELRIDMLANPLPFGGLYHTGYASYAVISTKTVGFAIHNQRLHAYYGLLRPVALAPWLGLTPRAGAFVARYDVAYDSDWDKSSAVHYIGELGLDLEANFHATWDWKHKLLGIDGLRHIVRPLVQWRRYGSAGDKDKSIVDNDFSVPSLQMPSLNLRESMFNDSMYMENPHLVRYGVENVLQTRDGEHGSRELASLGIFQDHYLSDYTDNMSYVQASLSPASFISLYYESGVYSDSVSSCWQRLRLSLKSADLWRLSLYADYRVNNYESYYASFYYKLSRNWGSMSTIGYDARAGEFDHGSFSLLQQLGDFWQLRYRVSYRKGDLRQDDVTFSVSVAAHRF